MDFDKLKGKTVDDAMLSEIRAAFDEERTAREASDDKARKAAKESIDGRKAKDARIARMAELLGVEPDADLDSLPDAKGQAEAKAQYEAKLKKQEREIADLRKSVDEAAAREETGKTRDTVAKAIAKHAFFEPEDMTALVLQSVVVENGERFCRNADGKLVRPDDFVAAIAKTKPHYLKPSGNDASGSGFGAGRQGSGGAPKKPERADFKGDEMAYIKAAAAYTRETREAATN